MKLNIATPICKVCFGQIKEESFATIIHGGSFACARCLREMDPRIDSFYTDDGIKASCLYRYNEKIKTILFNFKACFDYELKEVFFHCQKQYFRMRYKEYLLIPAPSYIDKDKARGFNHVEEMFSIIGLPIVKCIKKTRDVKQADLTKSEREEIGRYLTWDSSCDILGKKVLFIDDIFTTGSTASACCNLIMANGAKSVEILVMARTEKPT